jgi:hypothetical protein
MTTYSWGWLGPSGTQPQGLMSHGWLRVEIASPETPVLHKKKNGKRRRPNLTELQDEDEALMLVLYGFLHLRSHHV